METDQSNSFTLSLIAVCINMAFQFRSMDGASFFWYLIKLTLIGLFAFNWANFNAVANAVIGGLDYVAGALISSVGGGGAGATYFAAEFDDLITEFSQYLNAIGSNLNWMTGAILGGIGLVLQSLGHGENRGRVIARRNRNGRRNRREIGHRETPE